MKALVVALMAVAVGEAMATDSDSIERCRQIAEPAARLKCYDELPLPQSRSAARTDKARVDDARNPAGQNSRVSPVGEASRPSADPVAAFGLEERRRQPTPVPESIESAIPGRFEGWVGNSRFRLANGQVWEIRDGSQAAYDLRDPKVRIVRGMSGSFFMEISGVSQMPRVRRVE